MALLKISCSQCAHEFFRIVVSCNREGVDMTCPACEGAEGKVHVMKTKDGSTPFAPCTHINEDAQAASEPQTDSHHSPESFADPSIPSEAASACS